MKRSVIAGGLVVAVALWGLMSAVRADEKDDKIHELDAVVAHLYGLKEKHLIHIFATFHEGWDYEQRRRATIKHFRDWRKRL